MGCFGQCPRNDGNGMVASGNAIASDEVNESDKKEAVELKYILALLNSKIYYHWFYHRAKRKGEMLELYKNHFLKPQSKLFLLALDLNHQINKIC